MCIPRCKLLSSIGQGGGSTSQRSSSRGGRTNKKTIPRVQHEYHDHAHDPPPTGVTLAELQSRSTANAPFPVKLQEVLQAIEDDGHAETISWQPHGRCFIIHKPSAFKQILPLYFPSMAKLTSFQRQLNLYGFKRITQGRDKGCYYHEMFLRGRIFLAYQILRTKIKGTGVKAKANPDDEPRFWNMEFIQSRNDDKSWLLPRSAPPAKQESDDSNDSGATTCFIEEHQAELGQDTDNKGTKIVNDWGMSFYALDALPTLEDDLLSSSSSSSSSSSDDSGSTGETVAGGEIPLHTIISSDALVQTMMDTSSSLYAKDERLSIPTTYESTDCIAADSCEQETHGLDGKPNTTTITKSPSTTLLDMLDLILST